MAGEKVTHYTYMVMFLQTVVRHRREQLVEEAVSVPSPGRHRWQLLLPAMDAKLLVGHSEQDDVPS